MANARHPRRALALATLLVLSACGGDDATTTPTVSDATDDSTPDTAATTTPPSSTSTPPTSTPPTSSTPPSDAPTTTGATTTTSSTPPTTTSPSSTAAGRDLDPLVTTAIEALGDQQGVLPDDIEVVSFERVTWRDGSLGCPQPGRSYTQALVDGYRIVLSVDGTEYHYHGADGGQPSFCATPDEPAPGGVGGDT